MECTTDNMDLLEAELIINNLGFLGYIYRGFNFSERFFGIGIFLLGVLIFKFLTPISGGFFMFFFFNYFLGWFFWCHPWSIHFFV